MIIKNLKLPGVYLIEHELLADNRGFFTRVFCKKEFKALGLCTEFPQWSISHNKQKNTIRGMHFQKPPHTEEKLIMCTRGGILDILIDLRKESDTYKKWISVEMLGDGTKTLYIPKGIAHGFKTLYDNTDVFYHISKPYNPECSSGVLYNDGAFDIDWGDLSDMIISEKDLSWDKFCDNMAYQGAVYDIG